MLLCPNSQQRIGSEDRILTFTVRKRNIWVLILGTIMIKYKRLTPRQTMLPGAEMGIRRVVKMSTITKAISRYGRIGNVEGSNNQDLSVNVDTSASSHNVLHGNTISAMDVDVTVNIPFALVDEIAEASPAPEDGLQLGDQIVKFGNVESGDDLLPKLASEALSNQDREIPVVVLRQGALINLTVTPRAWQGRGMLGWFLPMRSKLNGGCSNKL
ncbi:hypothetical protein ACSBR2_025120 [Camellia fascicularis]